MNYSAEEVIEYILSEDVKFVRLAFCDVFGIQKNISILSGEIKRAFSSGIAIDASAIAGFGGNVHSDLFLHPDPVTLSVLPWRPEHGRVVRMFCSITYPDGTPFECDTRTILKNAVSAAESKGIKFHFGSEIEFYLFKTDEFGEPTEIPYDNAGYMDIAPDDKGENVRREICLTLEQMGIIPESSHHEEGPGQNEIDFRYSDPVTAADNAVTFKSVVSTVAARNGLFADFSAKPLKDKPGSGFHINFSAESKKGDVMPGVTAGILAKTAELTAFLNPTENSYERIGSDKAPKYISWSVQNRSQLVRIPAASGEYVRAELRSPDPSANPYLAFALMIYAGLYGVDGSLELPKPVDVNLFDINEDVAKTLDKLPVTLEKARNIATGGFAETVLPRAVVQAYCKD